jgi:hypothetical protein
MNTPADTSVAAVTKLRMDATFMAKGEKKEEKKKCEQLGRPSWYSERGERGLGGRDDRNNERGKI